MLVADWGIGELLGLFAGMFVVWWLLLMVAQR
jgi:hypothetical protein